MRKWTGEGDITRLPAEIEGVLRRRIRHVLERHGVPDEVIGKIVNDLVHQVSWAYAEYRNSAAGSVYEATGN
jgi:hypothetical protein